MENQRAWRKPIRKTPLGGTFGASFTIKLNKDGQTGGEEDCNGNKKSKATLLYALAARSQSQTFCFTSLSDDIRDMGDPSRSPRGPDSADSLLHTDVIANEENQGWLVPDS